MRISLLLESIEHRAHRGAAIATPLNTMIDHKAENPIGRPLGMTLAQQQELGEGGRMIDREWSPGRIELSLGNRKEIGRYKVALIGRNLQCNTIEPVFHSDRLQPNGDGVVIDW